MAPIVPDMSDKKAWDDSLLINSWDEAVNEYKVGPVYLFWRFADYVD
jgi:hypothetical protein